MTNDTNPQQQTPQQTQHTFSASSNGSTSTRFYKTEQSAPSRAPGVVMADLPIVMHASSPLPPPSALGPLPPAPQHLAEENWAQLWKNCTAADQAGAYGASLVTDVGIDEIVASLSSRSGAGIRGESRLPQPNVMPPAVPVGSPVHLGTITQVQPPNTAQTTGNTANEANVLEPCQQLRPGRRRQALIEGESSERRKIESQLNSTFARLQQEFDAPLSWQRECARLAYAAQYVGAPEPTTTPNDAASSSVQLLPPTLPKDRGVVAHVSARSSGRSSSVALQTKQMPMSQQTPGGRSFSL